MKYVLKRIFDIFFSGILILLLSPLFIIIAFLIRFDSAGSPLFTQERIGKNSQPFALYKFRSMYTRNQNDTGAYFTHENDKRITRTGRFLRKTSLDELPQLLNIFKGDMSLIGPRPYVPTQKQNYTEHEWQERHLIKPGLTGLAQIAARTQKQFTMEKSLALDLEYVKEYGFFLDLKIFLRTIGVVLKMKNF